MTTMTDQILEEVRKLMSDLPSTADIKMLIEQIDYLDKRIAALESGIKYYKENGSHP